jgi:general transcription factor 3C polypeptide 3 (transcription factor C subunit 4)
MRWLCNFYQFRNDPYRIYAAVINSGDKEANSYASYTQMKYLARSIKLMDAIVADTRRKTSGDNTNQPGLEEIRELNEAILAMNVDPSTANEQNYSRYYHIPEHLKTEVIDRMGIVAPTHANPIMLSLFGQIMNLTKNHIASSCKYLSNY